MRVAVFSTKPYDERFLTEANGHYNHELIFLEPRLTITTATLAEGCPAVCAFVHDELSAGVLQKLSEQGTCLVALRAAGFNNVDLAAAERLGMAVVRVPAYSPEAVAEHTIGLMLALNRKIHRAYARVREGNFALEGLLGFDMHGKTVGIIGTGATAIQAVPYLARYAKQLYVLQRTPSSVDERPNPPTDPDWVKTLQPRWQQQRQENFQRAAMEFLKPGEPDLICDIWTEISRNLSVQLAAEGWPELTPEQFMARREVVDYQVMERLRRRVDSIVKDPQTAEALKPYYRAGCKRPLSSNDYYPVFNQPNVRLIDVSDTRASSASPRRVSSPMGSSMKSNPDSK